MTTRKVAAAFQPWLVGKSVHPGLLDADFQCLEKRSKEHVEHLFKCEKRGQVACACGRYWVVGEGSSGKDGHHRINEQDHTRYVCGPDGWKPPPPEEDPEVIDVIASLKAEYGRNK